jgi:hypothetical protein
MAESVVTELRGDLHASPPPMRRRRNVDRPTSSAVPRAPRRSRSDFAHYDAVAWTAKIAPLAVGAVLAAAISIGWLNRDDGSLTPESGLGYWLGIVGAGSMLLLLLYPLRKRVRRLALLGTTAFWFRTHMLLGVIGPALILFHANFKLGSVNSNVALGAMLIVAASGIVGRYLYGKIHLGLYGRRAEVREILGDAEALKGIIGDRLPLADRVVEELNAFTERVMASPGGVLASLWSIPVLAVRARSLRAQLVTETRHIVATEGKRLGWSRRERRMRVAAVVDLVNLHVAAVRKAAAFTFYERLFALWHLLHLPLFFLLVLAAAIHVYAAHFY